jgi:predicted RNase H-like HicB family nuclease
LQLAITSDDEIGLPAISHRLPLAIPNGAVPLIFTLDLAPDDCGSFLVTCREVPDVVLLENTEEAALARAEAMIRESLTNRRPSPDFPY